ncbi:MAG: hypothetical protein ABIH46_11810 [Chloroflexota bacterium]
MADILDEAADLVQCKECPWYKCCVTPMRLSPEDIRRQLQSTMPGALSPGLSPVGNDSFIRLIGDMTAAAQSMLLEGCPIFIQRLRADSKLAERIKKMMQGWGFEDETDSAGDKRSPDG